MNLYSIYCLCTSDKFLNGENMLAKDAKISFCVTSDECYDLIDIIENDYKNYHGDLKHWNSGRVTAIKKGAQKKIDVLYNRADRLHKDEN